MEREITALTDYSISQAKQLLIEFGEFYPFAVGLQSNNLVTPVNVYWEEEFPTSEEVIRRLIEVLKNRLQENKFVSAALCADVWIEHPTLKKRMEAIEVKYQCYDKRNGNIYIPYLKEGEGFTFLEHYSEKGSMILIDFQL